MHNGHCLFVCYGGGHVAMLYPIIKTLNNKYKITILALTTAQSFLSSRKIPFIGYKDFPEAKNRDVQRWGNLLSTKIPTNGLVTREETVAYLGINFCELVETYGFEKAKYLYLENGRQAFLPIKTMERFLKRLNPDIVISTNSPRTEEAVFLAAKQLNMPSICLIDLFALQEIQWIGRPGYAKKLCVLNDFVKNNFIKVGRNPDEIIVTGNPAFDILHKEQVKKNGLQLKRVRGWDDGKFNILWASQPEPICHPFCGTTGDPGLLDRIEKQLRDIVRTDPRYRLIIRYHPSEGKRFVASENTEFSPCQEPLGALLHAIDLVVVTASTVGLQAHIIEKPVISIDSTIWANDVRYAQQGIAVGIATPKDLPIAIENYSALLKNKTVNKYPKNATQNVIRVIEDVLNGK